MAYDMLQVTCNMRHDIIMNESNTDYFPLKLAKGSQFCNRVIERKELKRNIELARHTVLVSPRRYGKSSLVNKVASELKIPFETVDLFLAHDDKAIIKRILMGIGKIISALIPVTQKALGVVQQYFKDFKVSFHAGGFGLELSHTAAAIDPADQILDALKSLAVLAEEKKKKVLFFIDEFQDIASAVTSKTMQGALRHVAQDTSWVVFVFSGSSRNLLLELFDDKNNPLYMLCDKILLDRMSSADYHPHIQKAAHDKWKKTLSEDVINKILTLTELHPFYVNLLCNELWKKDKVPNRNDVSLAWLTCCETEERRFVSELEKLTSNQQDILKLLARSPVQEPTSNDFLQQIQLPLSSVRLGIKALLKKDMIRKVKKEDAQLPGIKKGQYRVLDPLLAFALRKYE
jgi:AAA+ ATPase superfamily predicted ATPase